MNTPYSNANDFVSPPWLDPLWNWDMAGKGNPYIPDFNAADNAAFEPPPTTEMEAFTNLPTQLDHTDQNVLGAWQMPAQPSLDVGPVSQPVATGNFNWAGVAPSATYSVASTPDLGVSPISTPPMPQDELTWILEALQSTFTIPGSTLGNGGGTGWAMPEEGPSLLGVTTSAPRYPAEWAANNVAWSTPAMSSTVALGKRHREAEVPHGEGSPVRIEPHEMPPQKQARGGRTSNGIQTKAARSTARTRHKPAARIPNTKINSKPKEVGRGAERLASPITQGIYHPSLQGPSFQQGWEVETVYGQPTWVEGSVDEKAVRHDNSAVQQEQEQATNDLLGIPQVFQPMHKLFLQASEADFERGAVGAIKCRVCPNKSFKDFQQFKRHCDTSEKHPLVINFCDHCSDYFARPDSLKRHRAHPPQKCLKALPEDAADKRRVTEGLHEKFVRDLEHSLRTGKSMGPPFYQIMIERYPNSSKKDTGGVSKRS